MIPVFPYSGRSVAVFGLGRSGMATARALELAGADVSAWDDDPNRREAAAKSGIALVDPNRADWKAMSALVLSPGVPLTHPEPHPVVPLARSSGVEIIGDIELLHRTATQARFIGITGTNGKSTTTALVGHILSLAGQMVEVGGNLGAPALDLQPLGSEGTYILEVSSYQLALGHNLSFDIAALINLSQDHIDRHGSYQNYIAAKKRIFDHQTWAHSAVIGIDDEPCQGIYDSLAVRDNRVLVPVAVGRPLPQGVYVIDGMLYDGLGEKESAVADLSAIDTLPGVHNFQNAAVAYAIARSAGVSAPVAAACLLSFPGLAHRLENVAEIAGIRYVNDSKATNAPAAAQALACFDDVYWIAGGRPKADGIVALKDSLSHVVHAFLIGEAAKSFADTLDGRVPNTIIGDLEGAVAEATALAKSDGREGPVVLLSPACASFDQWPDFEARGEAFRAAVRSLMPSPQRAGGWVEQGIDRSGLEMRA